MKNFNGKAIYNPSGKAGEYSYWACNFYVGCSNGCTYCYCKKGVLATAMGQDTPQLKKCFKDENHAFKIFVREMLINQDELQKCGLFFSFTTDPLIKETNNLTYQSIAMCVGQNIPVKVLTKSTEYLGLFYTIIPEEKKKFIAIGFTLTGHDELEPNASTNSERIESMKKLHEAGFKTWASIEPIIDFKKSYNMMLECNEFCNLFKVGLMSGYKVKTALDKELLDRFMDKCYCYIDKPIYLKDSLLKQAGISRSELPNNCVGRDYNMFNN
jgi:DNA repair photolyase